MEKTIHEGRNIKRIREMLGIKQEALAMELGNDWNQKRVSLLEGKEIIDAPVLEEVAKALKVPVEAIKNFDEETAVTYFNTFHDNSINQGANFNYHCTFNPLEKYIEAMEENKKLYQQLLREKDAMIEELKRLLK